MRVSFTFNKILKGDIRFFRKCVLFFVLLITNIIFCQTPELKFEHFIDDKGLTQNTILDVIQDKDGFLWIGTANGLYQYDGQRFTVYRNIPKQTNTIINNVINKLAVDHNNVLWIGTVGGLCSFDIKSQHFFNSNKSLLGKEITAIYTDDYDNSVWIGTRNYGLYHILNPNTEKETFEHFFYQPYQSHVINSNRILSITKDRHGNLWVGTDKGLNRMYSPRADSKEFMNVEGFNKSIDALFLDSNEMLWVGELGTGLWSLEKPTSVHALSKESFKAYALNLDGSLDNFGNINAIKEDFSGKLWVGVYGYGLYNLNTETGEFVMHTPNDIYEESLSNRRIKTVHIDNTNVLWVGTEVGGLNKCDLQKKSILFFTRNKLSSNTLSNASVNAILEDDEYVWVGTENGLNQIRFQENYKSPQIQHHFFNKNKSESNTLIKEQSIKSVFKDSDGDYWIGKETVVNMQVDPVTDKASFNKTGISMPNVFSILEDNQGALWFGSFGNGLVKWKKQKQNNEFDFSNAVHYKSDINNEYSIGSDFVSCLYEDTKGNIWVGSLQGGVSLLVKGKNGNRDRFITYYHDPNNPNGLSHNSVFSIHEDKQGNYWIGTFGGGLNKMTLTKSGEAVFEHFSEDDGLANNAVYGILEDEIGNLWMSTDNGISCFNPKNKSFKNFNRGDGLQSNNFRKNAYYKNKHGYLFFGGLRGLNIFHPETLKDNEILAQPRLTGFKIKNELVEIGKEYNGRIILSQSEDTHNIIKLEHHENTLTFEFAALHYAAPEKNKFKYQLVGFDDIWQESKGLPFAHYTNLSSGNYAFKVKASNNDGIWNEIPAEFKFKISPPFWYTWWAFVIYILLLTGVIFAIISYLSLQEKEKASVKVQKEIEQVNRLKLQFFTNISHEFKTPITLILNPIEELLESIGNNPSVKHKLQVVQRNANSLLRLVHQLMEFRKIEVGETKLGAAKSNVVNFVREITNSFKSSANKNKLDITFESSLKALEIWFDWDKLEKILNNLIFNAIKFTNHGGKIVVRVCKGADVDEIKINDKDFSLKYLMIEVEDNGVGIKKDELPYVFHRFYQVNQTRERTRKGSGIGLAITKDLVELHYGKIEVDSVESEGTKFTIKLPMGNEHLLPEEMIETSVPDTVIGFDVDYDESAEEIEQDSSENKLENTVLVVDDNPDIRTLIKEGFYEKSNVLEAENGKEGLKIALKEMPDLIISDILMPEMDGIELCEALKTNIRTSHIPIILLTALNSVEHRIEGLESGADAYIPKPFKMKLLKVRGEKLIESRDLMRKRFQTEREITPEKVTLNSLDEAFLEKIMGLMETNMGNDAYWVDHLVADMNTSRSTFFRKLKKLTGQSPNDFIRMVRLKRAAQLLEQNELTISQISYMVGFSDPGYFGKCFRKFFGESPSNYVKKKMLS